MNRCWRRLTLGELETFGRRFRRGRETRAERTVGRPAPSERSGDPRRANGRETRAERTVGRPAPSERYGDPRRTNVRETRAERTGGSPAPGSRAEDSRRAIVVRAASGPCPKTV